MNITIDMATVLRDFRGDPVIDYRRRDETGVPDPSTRFEVTVRDIIQNACTAPSQTDAGKGWDEKAKLFALAVEANGDAVNWPVETVALIKERIGALYGPVIVGPLAMALDAGRKPHVHAA